MQVSLARRLSWLTTCNCCQFSASETFLRRRAHIVYACILSVIEERVYEERRSKCSSLIRIICFSRNSVVFTEARQMTKQLARNPVLVPDFFFYFFFFWGGGRG